MKGIGLFSKLVGRGSSEGSSGGVGHGGSVPGEVDNGVLSSSMALKVGNGCVSVAVPLFEAHVDLYEANYLVANVDVARNRDRVIGDFGLECNLGLQAEDERSTCRRVFGLVAQLEPFLRRRTPVEALVGYSTTSQALGRSPS